MAGQYYLTDSDIAKLKAIGTKVNAVKQRHPRAEFFAPPASRFLARLTSNYSSGYAWEAIDINEDGSYTANPDGGNSTDSGKIYHVNGCQTLISGEYVWVEAFPLFTLRDTHLRRTTLSTAATAGSGDGSSYGTATSPMGTLRNYSGTTIPISSVVYVELVGANWEIVSAACEDV